MSERQDDGSKWWLIWASVTIGCLTLSNCVRQHQCGKLEVRCKALESRVNQLELVKEFEGER